MKNIIIHEFYTSSPGVNWNQLVSEGIRDARYEHGVEPWTLEGVYEYDREVEDEKGRVIDIEARVVLRHVPSK